MTGSLGPRFLSRSAKELGLSSVYHSPRDTKLICLQRFLRLFACGACSLILALYLTELGLSNVKIGLFISLTMLGNVAIAFALTLVSDRLGRRNVLAAGAALMAISGVVFGVTTNYWVLLIAAILGIPSGKEIGPSMAIEDSILAQLTPLEVRSDVFAWCGLISSLGQAFGSICCGWIVERLRSRNGWDALQSYRFIVFAYTGLSLIKLLSTFFLSRGCEVEKQEQDGETLDHPSETSPLLTITGDIQQQKTESSLIPRLTKKSSIILTKLCILFMIDSMASGLIPPPWITYFFHQKFHLREGILGTLFFTTGVVSAFSNLVGSAISKRIGLVKAMVFTNLPSAVLLTLIPVPTSPVLAVIFLILRHCMDNMDNAPRSAFIASAILPSERTVAMGIVIVVKASSRSLGPVMTGALAALHLFWVAFVVAGCMKMLYNLGLLVVFINEKPREEEQGKPSVGVDDESNVGSHETSED